MKRKAEKTEACAMNMESHERAKGIYRITFIGAVVNLLLMAAKFTVGILGHSAALVADAIHSLSDLSTDIVVLAVVGVTRKPKDQTHRYGHGKFESLATIITAAVLVVVGISIFIEGARKVYGVYTGSIQLVRPSLLAVILVVIAILVKEWLFRITLKEGKRLESDAVLANAWDHRSDAFSSVAAFLGITGAYLLGDQWIVLDPIVSCLVSVVVIYVGIKLAIKPWNELTERALDVHVEHEILEVISSNPLVSNPHNLRTRSLGNAVAIEIDICLPNELTVQSAHEVTIQIEQALRSKFGKNTHVVIHIEPEHGLPENHD